MTERHDAVLAHTYMYKYTSEKPRSSIRGRIQVSALSHLYREGKIGKIFLAGGKVWGDQFPPLAEVMASELKGRSIPNKVIHIIPEAMDTPQEIDLFIQEAKKNGWENIASVANKTHLNRIRTIYKKRYPADLIAAEDVLRGVKHKHNNRVHFPYRSFLDRFEKSSMEIRFRIREALVRAAYALGLEKYLTRFAQSARAQRFKVSFDS